MCKYLLEKKQIIYRKYFKATVYSETQFAFMISIAINHSLSYNVCRVHLKT